MDRASGPCLGAHCPRAPGLRAPLAGEDRSWQWVRGYQELHKAQPSQEPPSGHAFQKRGGDHSRAVSRDYSLTENSSQRFNLFSSPMNFVWRPQEPQKQTTISPILLSQ